jgi:hypothetical protein
MKRYITRKTRSTASSSVFATLIEAGTSGVVSKGDRLALREVRLHLLDQRLGLLRGGERVALVASEMAMPAEGRPARDGGSPRQ